MKHSASNIIIIFVYLLFLLIFPFALLGSTSQAAAIYFSRDYLTDFYWFLMGSIVVFVIDVILLLACRNLLITHATNFIQKILTFRFIFSIQVFMLLFYWIISFLAQSHIGEKPYTLHLNGQTLLVAPPGPGNTQSGMDLPGNTVLPPWGWVGQIKGEVANEACSYLDPSGKTRSNNPQDYWRLPSPQEQQFILSTMKIPEYPFFIMYYTNEMRPPQQNDPKCLKNTEGQCRTIIRYDGEVFQEFSPMWRNGFTCVKIST